jgi:hypothetical protein
LFERAKDGMKGVKHLIDGPFHMFFHRDSSAKRTTVLVRVKHDGDELAFLTARSERPANLPHHRDVENIQRWTRKGYSPDSILNLESDVFVVAGHKVMVLS